MSSWHQALLKPDGFLMTFSIPNNERILGKQVDVLFDSFSLFSIMGKNTMGDKRGETKEGVNQRQ